MGCCFHICSYSIYFYRTEIFQVLKNVLWVNPAMLNQNSCAPNAFVRQSLQWSYSLKVRYSYFRLFLKMLIVNMLCMHTFFLLVGACVCVCWVEYYMTSPQVTYFGKMDFSMIFLCIFYIKSFILYLGENYLPSYKNNFKNLKAFQTLQFKTKFYNNLPSLFKTKYRF